MKANIVEIDMPHRRQKRDPVVRLALDADGPMISEPVGNGGSGIGNMEIGWNNVNPGEANSPVRMPTRVNRVEAAASRSSVERLMATGVEPCQSHITS